MYSSIKKRRKKSNKDYCISIRSIVYYYCFFGYFKFFYIINIFVKYIIFNLDFFFFVCLFFMMGKYLILGFVKFGLELKRK